MMERATTICQRELYLSLTPSSLSLYSALPRLTLSLSHSLSLSPALALALALSLSIFTGPLLKKVHVLGRKLSLDAADKGQYSTHTVSHTLCLPPMSSPPLSLTHKPRTPVPSQNVYMYNTQSPRKLAKLSLKQQLK